MNEARITINGKELSEGQSIAIRVALISFLITLKDKELASQMGRMAVQYSQRLSEVIAIIDETPQ
jgi:hypothetical protein